MIAAIVAVDNDWGIGYNGQLLEQLPPDMKHFRELTENHMVIMGRKTWESLPRKYLPRRVNVVVTHVDEPYIENATVFCNMKHVMNQAVPILQQSNDDIDWFIIGGGQIYKQLLPICDRAYVTKIINRNHIHVDTYFPNLDKNPQWAISECGELQDYNGIQYAFLTYDRIS